MKFASLTAAAGVLMLDLSDAAYAGGTCYETSDCPGDGRCRTCDGGDPGILGIGKTLGTCKAANNGGRCPGLLSCGGRVCNDMGVCAEPGKHRHLQDEGDEDEECEDDDMWGDPHMRGLRGQTINWSGVDGAWYSLVNDDNADLNVNVRVTAPLPDEFPDRQLMTGLAVLSERHSVTIEVENPYTTDTGGCPEGVSPCLANGGLRITVDGQEVEELLRFSRQVPVAAGAISVSASNLPVECRQFGGDKIWARMYQEILGGRRKLLGGESLEDWILRFDHKMPARRWCAKYIAENDLADLQSTHAIFKIETPTVTVRLNAGVNYQGDGELNWDGRVLPDVDFWQMDVGMHGLDIDNPALSGLLGETARPVYDGNGQAVMEGFGAFRGTVEDYRVSGALGVHFLLLDEKEEDYE
ncbi:unnamed protein product [Ectocarpus fasciculatus]